MPMFRAVPRFPLKMRDRGLFMVFQAFLRDFPRSVTTAPRRCFPFCEKRVKYVKIVSDLA